MFTEHAGDLPIAARSAEVIVPAVVQLLEPQSVIDVGCGTGAFVQAFLDAGVPQVHGVDAGPPEELLFDPTLYTELDLLLEDLVLQMRYDLAVCLEVGEHLPESAGDGLVDSLCRLSDRVLFSAAIPGQGGPGHVNEQWASWWGDRFARRGYAAYDAIRWRIWTDDRVAWWYRQNIILYAAPLHAMDDQSAPIIDVVHPRAFEYLAQQVAPTIALRHLPGVIGHTIRRSLRGRLSQWKIPGAMVSLEIDSARQLSSLDD